MPVAQVPLLLNLGEGERGLVKALDSGDTDLAHLALFHLHRSAPLSDFLAVLARHPAARRLFEGYCRLQVCCCAWAAPCRKFCQAASSWS